VYVSLGNKLPADLRFVDVASDLRLDRSVLTGESEPIQATVESTDSNMLETKNIGLQGTLCVAGSGLGMSSLGVHESPGTNVCNRCGDPNR
jgi:sodium/potassium-transporting ATPase subunit alpha